MDAADVYDVFTRRVIDFEGIEGKLLLVISALDSRQEFSFPAGTTASEQLRAVACALRYFLETFPEPVVPARCLESFAAANSVDLYMEACLKKYLFKGHLLTKKSHLRQ
jgi:hypothetical protein